jgi:hypothetical protein
MRLAPTDPASASTTPGEELQTVNNLSIVDLVMHSQDAGTYLHANYKCYTFIYMRRVVSAP